MAQRKQPPAGKSGDARRSKAVERAVANGAREGQQQVTDGEEGQESKEDRKRRLLRPAAKTALDQFGKKAPSWKRLQELRRRKIALKGNGVEIECGGVDDMVNELRKMQEQEPDVFAELVRSVRPRSATRLPEPTLAMAIARGELKKRGYLVPDGPLVKPEPRVAALLDAAYTETKEGVILREAAIYPSREFYEELDRVRTRWVQEVAQLAVEAAKDQGGGPVR